MTTQLVSTVEGAIQTLQTHFESAAGTLPQLNAAVYVGIPQVAPENNYLAIGDDTGGGIVTQYRQDWAGMPAIAGRKSETYGLKCHIRTWAGDSGDDGSSGGAAVSRLVEAMSLYNAVLGELQSDVGGSTQLTASGSWQVTDMDNPMVGPTEGGGSTAVITFTVMVINVRLQAITS